MGALYSSLGVIILVLLAFTGVQLLGLYSFFGIIVPYVAIAVFITGFVYRVLTWARSPVPFHIPTTCGQQKSLHWIKNDNVESPNNIAGIIGRMTLEVLVFRSLFRNENAELEESKKLSFKGNRRLWLGGLVFHWSLFIILFRHIRLFAEPVPSIVTFVQEVDGIFQKPFPILYITDIAILAALTYLFIRRVIFPQLRYISLHSDYLALLLLLGVVVQGCLMRLVYHPDVMAVKELAMGVLSLHPVIPEGLSLAFYLHLFLVCTLVAYFPFSKLMHGAGVLLSPTKNLQNNSRQRRHINPWDYPVKVHTYEEWEDEFRDKMKDVGLPVEREQHV